MGNVGPRSAVGGAMLQESFSESFKSATVCSKPQPISDRSDQTFDQASLICNNANSGSGSDVEPCSSEITT